MVVEGERVQKNFVGTPKMMCPTRGVLEESTSQSRSRWNYVSFRDVILRCSLGSRLGVIDGLCGQHGFFYPSEIFFFPAAGQQKFGHQFSFQVPYSHDRDAADGRIDVNK